MDISSCLSKYQKIDKLGEGTYGVVFKMRDIRTQEVIHSIKVDCSSEKN